MPTATGSYEQIDGSPAVRFERTFPHPTAQVWDAITDPARLAQWFPTTVEFDDLRVGAPITFRFAEDRYPAMSGDFREVSPPRRLTFTWGEDVLTFELSERDRGAACRLSFSVLLDSADKAARDATGWDDCLDMLDAVIAGDGPRRPLTPESWRARYDEYKRRGLPATAAIPE
ncbi:MAG TPA: SRPBCC family protein [Solirubrobacteraceae bacterium]